MPTAAIQTKVVGGREWCWRRYVTRATAEEREEDADVDMMATRRKEPRQDANMQCECKPACVALGSISSIAQTDERAAW